MGTATATTGGQVQYKCVFSEFPFTYSGNTLTPYDAKCDLITSGLTIPANHGFGVRMLVAAASGEYNAATNTATNQITLGASALVFAPTASTGTADIDVELSGVSTCNSDVEDESFFSQEAFTSTLDENMGPTTMSSAPTPRSPRMPPPGPGTPRPRSTAPRPKATSRLLP